MASLSKLTAALFAGSQENNLALASLNFDFSLFKVEAPAEYSGVGESLSRERRDVAEKGSSHITARKLGALFEQTVPSTPLLFEAYGARASSITRHPIDASGIGQRGIFSSYVGADATSIWAAATSGRGAIAVHLLACMLARIWKAPEATAIWSEIVEERKKELQNTEQNEIFSYASSLAGHVALTQDQLAEWDNSARAWLRHADRVRSRQQDQVKIILSSIEGLAVNAMTSTYRSVIDAWLTALSGMDNLLKGSPQGVSNGGLLLALSSWHLYPDIIALGNTRILQEDNAFPRGTTLTINLHGHPSKRENGIYWSLPLSNMRFYGAPVPAEGQYATESSRIDFRQLLQVVLGSVCESWGLNGSDVGAVARLFDSIRSKVAQTQLGCPSWLRLLLIASEDFLCASGDTKTFNRRLIALGRNRGSSILAIKEAYPPTIFGLANLGPMMRLLKSPESRLHVLRRHVKRYFKDVDAFDVIIRFRGNSRGPSVDAPLDAENGDSGILAYGVPTEQDVTISISPPAAPEIIQGTEAPVREPEPGTKKSKTNYSDNLPKLCLPYEEDSLLLQKEIEDRLLLLKEIANVSGDRLIEYSTALPFKSQRTQQRDALYRWIDSNISAEGFGEESFAERLICKEKTEACRRLDKERQTWQLQTDFFRDSAEAALPPRLGPKTYAFFGGDPEKAAIFVDKEVLEHRKDQAKGPRWARSPNIPDVKEYCDLQVMQAMLDADAIDIKLLVLELLEMEKQGQFFASLRALAAAYGVYEHLEGATISPQGVTQPIHKAKWAGRFKQHCSSNEMNRLETFACITYFESDGLDLAPSQFTNVMAISSPDSIYVSAWLVCDPAERQPANAICRLHGNVGKAGLILLVPPTDPQTLDPGIDNWKIIDREDLFDGTKADHFKDTSLHLRFTDWSLSVDVGEAGRGRRNAEASIVEALVSVHDRGKWIADLDILQALSKGCNQPDHEYYYNCICRHRAEVEPTSFCDREAPTMVTLKNWNEFLEHPGRAAVAMAHGNWEAKLALAVLGVHRRDRVIVSDRICKACYFDLEDIGGPECVAKSLLII